MSIMICRFPIALALLLTTVFSASAESPTNVVHKLVAAIRKADRTAIAAAYARLNPADSSWLDSLLESDENEFLSPTWCPESKTEGDAAVVVVATLKTRVFPDIDPCYLIRKDGKWLILPKHTQIEIARGWVPETTMQSLQTLKTWYTGRKKQLYAELNAEVEQATPQNAQEAKNVMSKLLTKRDPNGFPAPHRK